LGTAILPPCAAVPIRFRACRYDKPEEHSGIAGGMGARKAACRKESLNPALPNQSFSRKAIENFGLLLLAAATATLR
jgi:hypothetical protein